MDKVVCKKRDLKEGYVGHPVVGRNLAQGIIVEEFPNVLFDSGSFGIKLPDSPRMGLQIGDQDMVSISAVFEKSELLGLDGILRNGTTHNDKAMGFLPFVGLVSELRYFPSAPKLFETTFSGSSFDRGVFFGHNHITTTCGIEKLDDPLAKEPRIGSNPDTGSGNVFGGLGQTDLQEGDSPGTGGSISWPQRPMPKFLEMSFEAKQGMIGSSAMFLGIVAYTSPLDLAVDSQDDGIQIENQRESRSGETKQSGSELIVQGYQLTDRFGRKPLEKSPQGRLVGKPGDADQGEKHPIVLQDLGLVDSPKACHNRIQKRQNQVGGKIIGVALRDFDKILN
jgi:hypothetical protein